MTGSSAVVNPLPSSETPMVRVNTSEKRYFDCAAPCQEIYTGTGFFFSFPLVFLIYTLCLYPWTLTSFIIVVDYYLLVQHILELNLQPLLMLPSFSPPCLGSACVPATYFLHGSPGNWEPITHFLVPIWTVAGNQKQPMCRPVTI